ncbi:hypothetical protein TNCV_2850471 [Trichonephila clavipes]|nr:hypothetical protein TNCV_2850471 [Trichonephila clavipes]
MGMFFVSRTGTFDPNSRKPLKLVGSSNEEAQQPSKIGDKTHLSLPRQMEENTIVIKKHVESKPWRVKAVLPRGSTNY